MPTRDSLTSTAQENVTLPHAALFGSQDHVILSRKEFESMENRITKLENDHLIYLSLLIPSHGSTTPMSVGHGLVPLSNSQQATSSASGDSVATEQLSLPIDDTGALYSPFDFTRNTTGSNFNEADVDAPYSASYAPPPIMDPGFGVDVPGVGTYTDIHAMSATPILNNGMDFLHIEQPTATPFMTGSLPLDPRQHIFTMAQPNSTAPTPNTPAATTRHLCHVCPKSYSRRADLSRHAREHNRHAIRYACPHHGCHKSFLRKDKLTDHQRNMNH
ncbi:hypothetical protein ACMFMG_009648 [Clarireedia jacksonii]